MTPRPRAVFRGRDGVLNDDRGYIGRPEDFAWRPGTMHALRALRHADWRLVVVTNQSGIARGLIGPAEYENLTAWMRAQLAQRGIALDGVYHCPHLPDAPLAAWRRQCDCRKPQPGMLRRAARDLGLDLSACVMVGDKPSDMQAGRAAGVAACIRIAETTDPIEEDAQAAADLTCTSLAEAARWLLARAPALHP
jgi:D-glycero-D-manno-heptose 1,7-bisphosphate phosphatase